MSNSSPDEADLYREVSRFQTLQRAIELLEWYELAMGEGPRTFPDPAAWKKWAESAAQFVESQKYQKENV